MDKYSLMRMSENAEEDAFEQDEVDEVVVKKVVKTTPTQQTKEFVEKYKEFYTDIKTNIREDW